MRAFIELGPSLLEPNSGHWLLQAFAVDFPALERVASLKGIQGLVKNLGGIDLYLHIC